MKKLSLLMLVAGMFVFASSHAQVGIWMGPRYPRYPRRPPVRRSYPMPYFKPELHFSVGYGYPNLDKNALLAFYQFYRGSVDQKGPVFGSLDYQFSRSNSLGIMFSYGSANAPYYAYNATTPNQPDFTGQLKNYSVLLNLVRYMPTGTNVITPYLRTAFGINVWDQHYLDATGNKIPTAIPDPPTFAYQVGLGAKLRFDKHTGAFIEAGYGKYIVSAGLSFKLTR
jgi:hypothetical protein